MKYPTFVLAENPAALIVSQGQLVLYVGQREKRCLPQRTYKPRQGGEGGEGLQDQWDSIVTSKKGEQGSLWESKGKSSG